MPYRATHLTQFCDSTVFAAAGVHVLDSEDTYRFDAIRQNGKPKARIRIGRDRSKCDIPLHKDGYISRVHAVLERDSRGNWILHNASSNGTFVDGVRITAPVTLTMGMRLRVGYTELIAVDDLARVPLVARSFGELCYQAVRAFGNNSAASRRLEMGREYIRIRANKWKRHLLYGDAYDLHPPDPSGRPARRGAR